MANARLSNPSRIGKTLGAILSAPRRGATDDTDETDLDESVSPPVRSASEPDAVPGAAASPPPDRVPAAESSAAESLTTVPAATPGAGSPRRAVAVAAATSTALPPTSVTQPAPAPRVTAEDVEVGVDLGGGARRKKRETFLIPEDLADAMRNAIVHLSGPPLYYTLAEFGEHAIRNYMAEIEREHNGGRPFPQRPRAVRQGRPLR